MYTVHAYLVFSVQEQYLGGFRASASEMSSISETGTHLEHSTLQLLQEPTSSGEEVRGGGER